MRFLANENFPLAAVELIRQAGHDVTWVRTDSPGIDDREVLLRAVTEERILLTFDKDFGELAFHHGLAAGCGVILFRFRKSSSGALAGRIVAALNVRNDWVGHYSVVDHGKIRMRPLPTNGRQGTTDSASFPS
jgi:predicted nuclease of predicted toxin-antitoxin system